MSSESLRIANLAKQNASLALDFHDFGFEISTKQNIATASDIQEKLCLI